MESYVDKVSNIIDFNHCQCNDITKINHLMSAIGLTSIENADLQKSYYVNDERKSMKKDQKRILQLENKIKQLRKDIQVKQMIAVNRS